MTISFRTIVRGSLAVFGLAALAGQSANAATVTTIFSTGVLTNNPTTGAASTLTPANAPDIHYTVATSGANAVVATGTFAATQVYDMTTFPAGGANRVYSQPGNSQYIGPVGLLAAQNTFFDFRTTFSLAGFDPGSANLTGNVAADNFTAAIFLNGVNTGFTAGASQSGAGFTLPQGFTIPAGSFNGGVNTLDFIVFNAAGTTGNFLAFDADALRLSANPITVTPEPGSVAMLIGMGVTGAGFLSRRKRAAK